MRGANADGDRIRNLRRSLGLTQDELARRAECDVKTIRKAEKDGRVDLATLRRIAAALNVTSADLDHPPADARATEQANLQVILGWIDAFNRRDVDAILECWHDDGVLQIPGMEGVPAGGTFCGKDEIRAHQELAFQTYRTEHLVLGNIQVNAVDNFVFARGNASVVHIPSGRETRCYAVHEFRLEAEKIAEHLVITDTRAFQQLLQDDESPG
jgi:transcriptional regulator with XRE-family HTH domain